MQTLTVNIQDNFVKDFLKIIECYKDKVQLQNEISFEEDKSLEQDPYFYERQKQLQQDIEEIDSGKTKMISNKDFWNDIDIFTQTLQKQ